MNIQEQLSHLRRTVALIERKSERASAFVEDLLTGQIVETPHGRHFETETLYAAHQRYGSYEISDLIGLRPDLLQALSGGAIAHSHPTRWAFLDTETTGVATGAGTYAFLIGVGSIDEHGFRVRQFFMRDYAEEASVLHALAAHLARFDVLITYNGKSYDQPLLETRHAMCKALCHAPRPFLPMLHLDLLHGARRLFKLRLESCRLVNLENRILGVERTGDIPGEMIPYVFFEYLRTRRAHRLIPVFHHNVLDIVSLACLTGVIPEAFRDPANMRARHGVDLLGLARWLELTQRPEEALSLMRRAIGMGLPDIQLFRTLFEAGMIEKKLGLERAAFATFTDLSLSPNPYRAKAWEELAKHYEHRERNFALAIECVRAARGLSPCASLASRQLRLEKKEATGRRRSGLRLSSHA